MAKILLIADGPMVGLCAPLIWYISAMHGALGSTPVNWAE